MLIGVTERAPPASCRSRPTPRRPPIPAAMQKYQAAQNNLTTALIPFQRLQENYPDLKSNNNFMALQSQLEGTENRIAISRRDYNEAVRQYNTSLETFPLAVVGQDSPERTQAGRAVRRALRAPNKRRLSASDDQGPPLVGFRGGAGGFPRLRRPRLSGACRGSQSFRP